MLELMAKPQNYVLKLRLFRDGMKLVVGERQCCRPPCVHMPGQVELLPCDWLMSWFPVQVCNWGRSTVSLSFVTLWLFSYYYIVVCNSNPCHGPV